MKICSSTSANTEKLKKEEDKESNAEFELDQVLENVFERCPFCEKHVYIVQKMEIHMKNTHFFFHCDSESIYMQSFWKAI